VSVIAAALRELMAAGVTGDALVEAVARIEAAQKPVRSSAAERQARYRQREKEKRAVTRDVTCVTDVTRDAPAKKSPPDPLKETSSDPNGSGADAPPKPASDADQVWGPGLQWLAREANTTTTKLRSLVGRWVRDHGPERVWQIMADGMASPMPIAQPVEWMTAALQNRNRPNVRQAPIQRDPSALRQAVLAGVSRGMAHP